MMCYLCLHTLNYAQPLHNQIQKLNNNRKEFKQFVATVYYTKMYEASQIKNYAMPFSCNI